MNQKSLWSVLIIATMVFSASCIPGVVKEETKSPSAWQQVKGFSTRAITGLRNIVALLTAPKLKDRKDICVWKICSRPLKKTNKITEKKPSEIGRKLSDVEMIDIWKNSNSRRV